MSDTLVTHGVSTASTAEERASKSARVLLGGFTTPGIKRLIDMEGPEGAKEKILAHIKGQVEQAFPLAKNHEQVFSLMEKNISKKVDEVNAGRKSK